MAGGRVTGDDSKQKTLSFFYPYTMPKKSSPEQEMGDMIVVDPPPPSFFAKYASKRVNEPREDAQRLSSATASLSRPPPRALSRKRSHESTPHAQSAQPSRQSSRLSSLRSPPVPTEKQTIPGRVEAVQEGNTVHEAADAKSPACGDGESDKEGSKIHRRSSSGSTVPSKRQRLSEKAQGYEDTRMETMPKLERRISAHNQTIFVEATTRLPSRSHSPRNKNEDEENLKATSIDVHTEAPQLQRPDSPAPAFTSSASFLSTLSHTPSVDAQVRPRIRPFMKQPSLVIRSSQQSENEEDENQIYEEEIVFGEDDKVAAADSDSSLEDLDDVLALFSSPKRQTPRSSTRQTRSRLKESITSTKTTDQKSFFSPLAPTPTYKFSVNNLIKQHARDTKAQAALAAANAVFATTSAVSEKRALQDQTSEGGIQDILSTVVVQEDGEQKVEQMMQALNRTDALRFAIDWFAFEVASGAQPLPSSACPISGLTGEAKQLFEDEDVRRCSLLTGQFIEQSSALNFPDDMIIWIWKQASSEPNEEVSHAYMKLLKSCFSTRLRDLIQPEHISNLFRELGASTALIEPQSEIRPARRAMQASGVRIPRTLTQVIRLIGALSDSLSDVCKELAIEILLRMGIDGEVGKHAEARFTLQDAIATLIDSLRVGDGTQLFNIRSRLLQAVSNETLALRLVTSIPDFSPSLSLFRRQMALGFFFRKEITLTNSPEGFTELSSMIVRRLKTSDSYDLDNSNFDYVKLTALITMLDIGMAGSFEAPAWSGDANTADERQAEDEFNSEVDRVSKRIYMLSSRILDSGASHMSRSDAKSALERLHVRLTKAVRSKAKAKKSVFASSEASIYASTGGGEGTIMAKFLQKRAPFPKGE